MTDKLCIDFLLKLAVVSSFQAELCLSDFDNREIGSEFYGGIPPLHPFDVHSVLIVG